MAPSLKNDIDFHPTSTHTKKQKVEGQERSSHRKTRSPQKSTSPATPKKDIPTWTPADFNEPIVEGQVRFNDLNISNELLHAIADMGFQYCTPIQAEILPSTLSGKDAFGQAQTGTGKTAAFLISVITHLERKPLPTGLKPGTPRVLVLAPTRELVMQIGEEAQALCKYTKLSVTAIFGGMDYEKQRRRLDNAPSDIIVATPGRLLDFKRQRVLHLDKVEIMIIDEADRMLDMGFIPDVRKIVYATPHKSQRQTLLFSATLTPEVQRLAEQWTRDPVKIEIKPDQVAVDTVEQIVYIVTNKEKVTLLYNIILNKNLDRVLVFCNRKDETRHLCELLQRYNINCAVLSGDIRQQTRLKTLNDFKNGKIRVLVATDVAGRGIHIDDMNHVINYTLPRDPEDYVHRIGRTGRAGHAGTSISFADEDDSFNIPSIEKLIGNELPCIYPDDTLLTPLPQVAKRSPSAKKTQSRRPAKSFQNRPRRRSSQASRTRHERRGVKKPSSNE